jgi:DNA-binding winged helix-turn-helix (wHTH) protein/tetratricopeptide (TPR) repeat protein
MSSNLRIGDLDVDLAALEIRDRDGVRRLEPRAAALLARLAETPGEVVSRDELIASVWGHPHISKDALAVTMHRLRQALGRNEGDGPIETVPRRGYRLNTSPRARSRALRITRYLPLAAVLAIVIGTALVLSLPTVPPVPDPDSPSGMLVRAEALWERREPAAAQRAVQLAHQALEYEAAGAGHPAVMRKAHALLGRFYGYKTAHWLGLERTEAAARGREHLDRALAIAPPDPQVLTTAASFALYSERDPERARRLATRAVAAAPEAVPSRQVLAKALAASGNADRAGAIIEELARRAPTNAGVQWDRAFILFLSGRHEQSLRALKTAVSLSPRDSYWMEAFNLHAMGRHRDAAVVWAEDLRRDGCPVMLADDVSISFRRLLAAEDGCRSGFAYHRGLWAFHAGDIDLARKYFAAARAEHDYMYIWEASNPLPHRRMEISAGAQAGASR